MRPLCRLALSAALVALLPLGSAAQETPRFGEIPMFARPFQYTDADGPGTLTVTPLTAASTRWSFQPIQVSLVQGARRYNGAGAYHAFPDNGVDLPPFTLIAFTLESATGRSYFFQGRIAPVNGYTGEGTYYAIETPQTTLSWRVQSTPGPEPLVDGAPTLKDYWSRIAFNEALGGVYYATYNTFQGVESTATWSGSLPTAGRYAVDVFIPRQSSSGGVPRTSRAVYQVYDAGPAGMLLRSVNQQVAVSQWVSLGSFTFGQNYRIVLVDETGEARGTRSIVANAIRLTPAPLGF